MVLLRVHVMRCIQIMIGVVLEYVEFPKRTYESNNSVRGATTSASGRRLGDSTTTHRPRQRPFHVETAQKKKNIVTSPGHCPPFYNLM